MTLSLNVVFALCRREILKFVRDRSRLLGALIQPLGFWLLLGLGFQGAFRMPGVDAGDTSYMAFLFPGIIALMLLFTAIFSTIAIIEDRKAGFLQAALVAPVSRMSLVLGNVMGGAVLALIQAGLFFLLAPLIDIRLSLVGVSLAFVVSLGLAIGFTALGFAMAWRSKSTRGFHAVMNLVLFPLWLLSGGFFPLAGASGVLRWLMLLNPVTYGVDALRTALYWPASVPGTSLPLLFSTAVTWLFALLMLGFALRTVQKGMDAGL